MSRGRAVNSDSDERAQRHRRRLKGAHAGYRRSGPPLGASLRDDSPRHPHDSTRHHRAKDESITSERYSHAEGTVARTG